MRPVRYPAEECLIVKVLGVVRIVTMIRRIRKRAPVYRAVRAMNAALPQVLTGSAPSTTGAAGTRRTRRMIRTAVG